MKLRSPTRWSRLRPSRSLYARYLWASLALVLLITLGVGALFVKLAYDEARQLAATAQIAAARIIVTNVDSTLKPLETEIARYANFPWASVDKAEKLRVDELRGLMSRHDVLRRVDVFDRHANVRLSLSRGDAAEHGLIDAVTESQLQTVRRGAIDYSSVKYQGNVAQIELTVRDTRREHVISRYLLDMRFVSDALASALTTDVGATMVIDEAGSIIAHSDPSLAIMRASFANATRNGEWLARAAQTPQTALTRVQAADASAVYAASLHLPRFRWIVVALQSEAHALKPVRRAIVWSLGVAFAAMALTAYLAALMSRRLVRPVAALEQGATRIAAGDLTHRLDVTSNDELGALATAFNSMSVELARSYGDLERRVAEKTAHLAVANAQLEAASKHKSDFLAHMSHELRTPLNAVIGFSEMLKAQYFGSLNDKQLEYARDIHDSGQHLLALINDVLDLAKVEAGHVAIEPRVVDVAQAVGNCTTVLSDRIQRKRQSLRMVIETTVSHWALDERKFRQCLLNLLSNATKFTPEGGEIHVNVAVVNDQLEVVVADSGIGIPQAAMTRLFDEFYQVAGESGDDANPTSKGTGLGLALTRRFVELHGGTISARSEPGKGTVFTMRFPQVAKP